ncbi:DUF1294 domain-containing protein [Salimicrobium halophilum]|uniref:Uncharacterized membrane protein YsdA, DUF1294 family n=1 Tax=Salimicrobium halophilum TaxID=86666 RepID=A0A1G8VGD6_9BACI|nr:DUF1294 domain-containing protein [Salimicrobium halophilum]SDJ65142.1 Uncharacterized membrane protein YsdA, DUF1294 family [Salimicrobium halophilum]
MGWLILSIMSTLTFIVMGLDKWKARRGKYRIPENKLFTMAVFGGAPGGVAGMAAFRHKTKKKKFLFLFPFLMILEIGLLFFLEWPL